MPKFLLTLFSVLAIAAMPAAAQNDTVVKLAGSNTIGGGLLAEYTRGYALKLGMGGTTIVELPKPDEFDIIASRPENKGTLRVHVEAHGTGTGAARMFSGQADIWMASRRANQSDLDQAKAAGGTDIPALADLLKQETEHVIALDALTIVVHPSNRLRAIKQSQLREIFTGAIANWSQLGGPNQPIVVFGRDAKSGTFDTFCTIVVPGAECAKALSTVAKKLFGSSEDLMDAVNATPGAIGFVGYSFGRNGRTLAISNGCDMPNAATDFTIKAEEYPLSRRLYLYTRAKPSDAAREFVAYIQSDAAQAATRAAGFVDFEANPSSADYVGGRLDRANDALDDKGTRVRPSDVHAFEDATVNALRLPITFRFEEGTDQLDSRSADDLKRLATLLKTPDYANKELVLIGFSHPTGDYSTNRTLSGARARGVADQLRGGYQVEAATVLGVGPAAPVACNLDESGRSINQRVEVWVRPKS